MQRSFRLSSPALAGALATAFWVAPAAAHIDLIEPPARAHGTAASGDPAPDQNSDQKGGPCGQITNGRTDRVTTYAPGETITVQVTEETNHDSYLRVSLDLDGDDDFPLRSTANAISPETQEQAQAAEEALGSDTLLAVVRENNNANNFVHEIDVTLPDETCDNCTLQVIQLMYDTAQVYYFQCADIRIAEGGATGEGDAGAAGSAGAGGEAGSGGNDNPGGGGSASGAAGSATTGSGGTSSSAGAAGSSGAEPSTGGPGGPLDPVAPSDSEDDGGGCSLSSAPRSLLARSGAGWLGLGLAAFLFGRRRSARLRPAR